MLLFYLMCLAGIAQAVRFNAKEINANFRAVNKQLTMLERKVNFLRNATFHHGNRLRNSTNQNFWLYDQMNRLHRRIEEMERIQNRQQTDGEDLKKDVADNKILIQTSNVNLQNQLNNQHSSLSRRLEKLEQENKLQKENIKSLEDKLRLETAKYKNLFSRVRTLSGSIWSVHYNMSRSIEKLRKRHEWLATYIYNKTTEDTNLHNNVRHLQNHIQDLQQQLHYLETKIEEGKYESEHKLQANEEKTEELMKSFKEKLFAHIKDHAKNTQVKSKKNTSPKPTISTTFKPTQKVTEQETTTGDELMIIKTEMTTSQQPSTFKMNKMTTEKKSSTQSTISSTKTEQKTTATKAIKTKTQPTTTTRALSPTIRNNKLAATSNLWERGIIDKEELGEDSHQPTEHIEEDHEKYLPLMTLLHLLRNGGYRGNMLGGEQRK